ncbi:RCC1-like G exchanging factor-like protein [Tribolium castaneum]|uniref:Putative E3 ubiquitin-protein ligase HERC2-like Protein n=1 Tax=Tribolium castaneum TaxID=7070 RepID=D6X0Q4_TRICA|nr:PREDICTED: Williams-Beuren syndrome chromosomal region 16 protein homolog [Tribolium castaneum]EFA10131.2 putative E3 ubiquitin-protein ligase HERC2-like Protein [Tribolium castaneum]|eukprot:XP_008197602.1 PREDICTED: Williams-Beuren syndrome chromosomal region 16 protein homolog [Tribolium castaneum]
MLNHLKRVIYLEKCPRGRFMSVKRKYPIDRDEAKSLPVFDYGTSKKSYKRVFVWGNLMSGALGIPYLRRNENVMHRETVDIPKRLGFAEKFPVTTAACGFGFTAFGVDTESEDKLYGTGLNTDSQIGRHEVRQGHPLEIIYFPQAIKLPLKNPTKTRIRKLAAGRAHLVVLTDEGLFLLGNNAYGQCGREIIQDENYFLSNYINHIPDIDSKKVTDIECGQDHTLAVTDDGAVYSCGWGADGQTGLGTFDNTSAFTRITGEIESEKIVKISSRSDFALALNDRGEVFGWGNAEYDQIPTINNEQQVSNPVHLKHLKVGKVVDVAAGGSFCLALNEHGEVFVWGYGLVLGGPKAEQTSRPRKLPEVLFGRNDFQPNNRVVQVACGLSYAMAVTSLGDVYAWGRNMRGCLGLGFANDQNFPFKVALGGYASKVFCGYDHTVALCKPFI